MPRVRPRTRALDRPCGTGPGTNPRHPKNADPEHPASRVSRPGGGPGGVSAGGRSGRRREASRGPGGGPGAPRCAPEDRTICESSSRLALITMASFRARRAGRLASIRAASPGSSGVARSRSRRADPDAVRCASVRLDAPRRRRGFVLPGNRLRRVQWLRSARAVRRNGFDSRRPLGAHVPGRSRAVVVPVPETRCARARAPPIAPSSISRGAVSSTCQGTDQGRAGVGEEGGRGSDPQPSRGRGGRLAPPGSTPATPVVCPPGNSGSIGRSSGRFVLYIIVGTRPGSHRKWASKEKTGKRPRKAGKVRGAAGPIGDRVGFDRAHDSI